MLTSKEAQLGSLMARIAAIGNHCCIRSSSFAYWARSDWLQH